LKNLKKINKNCDIDNDKSKSPLSGEGVGVNGHKNKKKHLKNFKNSDISFYSPVDTNDDDYEICDMRDNQIPSEKMPNSEVPSPVKYLSTVKSMKKTSTSSQNYEKNGFKKSKDFSMFAVPFPRGMYMYIHMYSNMYVCMYVFLCI
jgi:hypothetical protein